MPGVTLVRTAPEIITKSSYVRAAFTRSLGYNVRLALRARGAKSICMEKGPGRFFIMGASPAAARALQKTFGVHAYAHALHIGPVSLEEIARESARYASRKWRKAGTFAVRAKRSGRTGFSSHDIEIACGAAILEQVPALKVDLSAPQKTLYVEAYEKATYLYDDVESGPGGLPVGVSGKVGVLFEKGSKAEGDCAKLLFKRGCAVRAIVRKQTTAIKKRLRTLEPWNAGAPLLMSHPKRARRACVALACADTVLSPRSAREFAAFDEASGMLVLRPLLLAPKEVVP